MRVGGPGLSGQMVRVGAIVGTAVYGPEGVAESRLLWKLYSCQQAGELGSALLPTLGSCAS